MASLRPTISLKPELSLLVSLAHQTSFHQHGSLPEELFRPEAIATAMSIGEGGTFAVSRKQVPKQAALTYRVESKGITITHQPPHTGPPLPEWVVYKVAQIEFMGDGHAIPDHRHRLAAALVEFLVLTHDPVIHHPFLPSLYGFGWSQNRYLSQQRIPVPVLDWAEYGSLASYQLGGGSLKEVQRKQVIWEVGTALAFLHACEIYHGDVKAENVLLYRKEDGGFTAKLTDFGMSVVAQHGHLNYLPPGTLQWTAPEIRWVRSSNIELDKADVFSFGLLAWRVYCDGHDPLCRLFLGQQLRVPSGIGEDADLRQLLLRPDEDELQKIFEQNSLTTLASSFYWRVNLDFLYTTTARTLGEQARNAALHFLRHGGESLMSSLAAAHRLPFLVDVFQNTLSSSPSERDLGACLAALEENEHFQR
jgi:serine/threonine protein kinase